MIPTFFSQTESDGALQIFQIVFIPAHGLAGCVGKLGYGAAVDCLQLDNDIQRLDAGIV